MKKICLIPILIGFVCKSQNAEKIKVVDSIKEEVLCDLLPSVKTESAVYFHIKEISSLEFNSKRTVNIDRPVLFPNSDSIEDVLIKKYPKTFNKKNGAYIFNSYLGDKIIIKNNLVQDKSYSKYVFKASYKNYIFIVEEFYEGGNTLVIDLETNKCYSMYGEPHFITDKLLYGYTFNYGDTDFKIIDIEKKEYVSLYFENVVFEDSYSFSNIIRIKAKCLNSEEIKYLEIFKH
jgi:hypothetical protein